MSFSACLKRINNKLLEILKNNRGMALVAALLIMVALTVLGMAAIMNSSTEIKIAGNYRTGTRALYIAEAGIQEALYRLSLFNDNTQAPPSGSRVIINGLTNNNAYIDIDPNGLLTNGSDDDGNGWVDDISDLNYHGTYDNRDWKTIILLKTSDDTDTSTLIITPTIQPAASWLNYSSSTMDGNELTIEFYQDETDMDGDANTDEIVFYNGALTNPFNVDTPTTPASGQPVIKITSTGRDADSERTIVVLATRQPLSVEAQAAVMVDMAPYLTGSAFISGFDHQVSTSNTLADKNSTADLFNTNGIDNHGGKENFTYPNPNPPPPNINYNDKDSDTTLLDPAEESMETNIDYGGKVKSSGNHIPGVWSTGDTIDPSGAGMDIFGGNDTIPWKDQSDTNTWKTLDQLLGVSPEQLNTILAGANVTESDQDPSSGKLNVAPQGLIYIDNNDPGDKPLKITSSTPNADNGWGLMYITGEAEFQALTFKGLIFVEGDAHITGNFWLLGCLAVKGITDGDFSAGNGTFLFSREALERYSNAGMKFVTLSWKED
jgi:hypothetical protein